VCFEEPSGIAIFLTPRGGFECADGEVRRGGSLSQSGALGCRAFGGGSAAHGAMITRIGAHGLIPRSLASSAISQALIPVRLWARAISSAMRALGEPLADLSTVGGMFGGVDGSGCPGAFPACGQVMPSTRPLRVEARRALAALVWHGREQ
jgi:hypothetical protein